MEMNKKQIKERKKEYKKACRKSYSLWKTFTLINLPLATILIIGLVFITMFDNTVALFVGGSFWELENEDKNAVYYESDFKTDEERVSRGYELVKKVEGEGATLLTNKKKALPLEKKSKVSLFSTSSVNLVYGGTGSANVDSSKADNLKVALEKVGVEVNKTLWDFYLAKENAKYLRAVGGTVSLEAAKITEMPWKVYTKKVLDSVEDYSDAAIVTLSRVGGEGADLEFVESNYLALDKNEKSMMKNLKQMKDEGKIKKIIVLINSSNPLQVDFLEENEYGIDATLWIGGVGVAGINAVAEILVGDINPSGSLVDTYCYDNYSSPAMKNFIPTKYKGYKEGIIPENASTYMIYQEGIYVGYKYYETRYEDYVMGTGNAGKYDYNKDVAFPFGYGLSYSKFKYSNMKLSYNKDTKTYTIRVKVTNTGDVAGKETVQIYVSSPYTKYDIKNGVEKASVSLVGFDKTKILKPGKSQTLTITVDGDYIASYDAYGAETYILDAGDYLFTAATDSHNAVNNILAAKGYTPKNTKGRMDAKGNKKLVKIWSNPKLDKKTYAKSDNGTKIKNQLSKSDINLNNGVKEKVTYLSRSNWEDTMPTDKILKLTLTEYLKEALQDVQYDASNYKKVKMPTLGAKNGIKLVDMIGLEYNDPKWDKLLDQLTFEEMVEFVGDAFHWTMPVKSVEAPGTRDENGPQGLTVTLFGAGLNVETTALTSEDVLAATFNTDLVYDIGNIVGNDCLEAKVACLYGPGANTHRTPYGGRNFEYYSEDAYLSAAIGAAEVKGIEEKGVFVVMKHFALNDCEQDRIGQAVWLTEQAAREIYLRAFQGALEESWGRGNGVMMAYTRWGTQWSGANAGLLKGILNGEWGCNGLQITDNVLTTYVNGVDGVMAGTTAFDSMLAFYITEQLPKYKDDPVVVSALREACHHNLYAIAHSSGMNGVGPDTTIKLKEPMVQTVVRIGSIVFIALFLISLIMWIIKLKKFRKTEEYISYMKFKKNLKATPKTIQLDK